MLHPKGSRRPSRGPAPCRHHAGGEPAHCFPGTTQGAETPGVSASPASRAPSPVVCASGSSGTGPGNLHFSQTGQGSRATPGRAQPDPSHPPPPWEISSPRAGPAWGRAPPPITVTAVGVCKEPWWGGLTFCSSGWPHCSSLGGGRLLLSRPFLPFLHPAPVLPDRAEPRLGLGSFPEPSSWALSATLGA